MFLVIADSVSKYITCAAGFDCRKFLTIDKAKKVLPVLDSPARAVILLDGRPPKMLPLTRALKMKLPVSTKESQSPDEIPSSATDAYSLSNSLITFLRKLIIQFLFTIVPLNKERFKRSTLLNLPSYCL